MILRWGGGVRNCVHIPPITPRGYITNALICSSYDWPATKNIKEISLCNSSGIQQDPFEGTRTSSVTDTDSTIYPRVSITIGNHFNLLYPYNQGNRPYAIPFALHADPSPHYHLLSSYTRPTIAVYPHHQLTSLPPDHHLHSPSYHLHRR